MPQRFALALLGLVAIIASPWSASAGPLEGPTRYRDVQSFSPLLVVLRYPSQVDAAALPRMRAAVRGMYRTGGLAQAVAGLPDTEIDRAVTNQLAKTTYYAFELGQYLSRRLPPETLVLQPTRITVDAQGRLLEVSANLLPPTVLILDFQVTVTPIDVLRSGDQTFGHWITPEFGVTTAFQAWPSSIGTIATRGSYEPSFAFDPIAGARGAGRTSYVNDLNKTLGLFAPRTPDSRAVGYSSLPIRWDRLLQLPKITYEMPKEEVLAQASAGGGPGETPPARALYDMISATLVGGLTEADHYLATRDSWIAYIELYDPSLARRWPRWPRSEMDTKRLAVIRRFAETERRFLSGQDSQLMETAYRGDFGNSMRKLFAAEMGTRDRTAQAIARTDALMMLAMVTGAVGGDLSKSMSQLPGLDQQSKTEAANLVAALRNHFGRIQDDQATYAIETGEGLMHIRAQTLSELRERMRSTYGARFSGREPEGERGQAPSGDGWLRDRRTGCYLWYGPPGDNASTLLWTIRNLSELDVEWSGPCRDGKAHGYGLARFFRRQAYFGEVEGNFEDGWARGRATSLIALAYDPKDEDGWTGLNVPYQGPFRTYIAYFSEANLDGGNFSGGRLTSSQRGTLYRLGTAQMRAEEIASFEADRKKFRAFRFRLIPQ